MAESTPHLITPEQFNSNVQNWTVKLKQRIRNSAPVYSGKEIPKDERLQSSITSTIKKNYGVSEVIRYKFARHGVFVHYGVGRGYVRVGNSVVRGNAIYDKNKKKKSGFTVSGAINRKPNDWYDTNIVQSLPELADITQEYYGDEAMNKLISNIDKFLIQKNKK